MANRTFKFSPRTQGAEHIYENFQILPHGASPPSLGEGDPKGTYFVIQRGPSGPAGITGATGYGGPTGVFGIKTIDPFLAMVSWQGSIAVIGQQAPGSAGSYSLQFGTPFQNADFTWFIPFTVFVGTVPTDLADNLGTKIAIQLVMRNSTNLP